MFIVYSKFDHHLFRILIYFLNVWNLLMVCEVKGLRKYLSASSKLFDNQASKCEIINLECNESNRVISVRWRIEGVLNLPWKPKMKPWTGTTYYHLDTYGLIESHIEEWDISVLDAYLSTLFPKFFYGESAAQPIHILRTESLKDLNHSKA